MGSESTAVLLRESSPVLLNSQTTFHVTGFKKFHGVPSNPTEVIVSQLVEYLAKSNKLPPGCELGSCDILETAGAGNLTVLCNLLRSPLERKGESQEAPVDLERPASGAADLSSAIGGAGLSPSEGSRSGTKGKRIIWLHLGVNCGATKFCLERRAVNEATFRCPDELGWQPQEAEIREEDGPISFARETTVNVDEVAERLRTKGFDVGVSTDAGRFVCNYVYYHSLSETSAVLGAQSLFVHVPAFMVVDEDTQLRFVAELMNILSTI